MKEHSAEKDQQKLREQVKIHTEGLLTLYGVDLRHETKKKDYKRAF
jgi:hypothetical protein